MVRKQYIKTGEDRFLNDKQDGDNREYTELINSQWHMGKGYAKSII